MEEITLSLNGLQLTGKPGTTILELAQQNDISIPTLCYDPHLKPAGACRVCLVENEATGVLLASCVTPIAAGMVINTESPKVIEARRTVVELLLASHPDACIICDEGSNCELGKIAADLEISEVRYTPMRHYYPIEDTNPFIERDLTKCILCGKCIRGCQELQEVGAIDYAYRGFDSMPATSLEVPLEQSPCIFCGLCVTLCPTGALSEKMRKDKGRETRRVRTICPYCGCGCGIYLDIRDQEVIGVSPDGDNPVNNICLCVKGRFGYDFINHKDRLTTPLVRRNGNLEEASWDEALDLVASKLQQIRDESGADSIACLSSAKSTNEENYLMQKFARAVVGTNNVDHCARLCHASTVAGLASSYGSGAMTNSIAEIEDADVILVTGSNTTENHPIISIRVKRAVRKGAKLIVVDPRKIDLTKYATLWLRQNLGTDVAWLNGMMHIIIEEGLWDEDYVKTRTENFDALKETVKKYTPEFVEKVTGIPQDMLREAARIYASGKKASILFAMGITQHSTGTDNVKSIANLAMLCGNVGIESAGVNPLRGQNNVQGACDMGALPNVFPGYQAVGDQQVVSKFETAWGKKLSTNPGLTVVEMMNAAEEGKIRAMYLMGENPMISDPDLKHVEAALKKLDFLVVQDIFLTEAAELADVVLPAVTFAERDGTFTNTERKVQRIREAINPVGEARPDWQIICQLASRMGDDMNYQHPSEIMEEIAKLTPSYGGIYYDRLENGGLQWPCPDREHPGTKYLHKDRFTRGLGLFQAIEYIPPAEMPDEDYPYFLSTGRVYYHFHTGSMTRRSQGLDEIYPHALAEINPADARELGVEDGAMVKVTSRRGEVEVEAMLTERVPQGMIFMSFHFSEAAANVLTNPALDPVAKIPELKVCAVRVEKA
ncbi:putative formate dehydrogenase [subsurface metagenome]